MSTATHREKKSPRPHASPIYNHLAPAYQALWPAVAGKNIRSTVSSLRIPAGARVLDVGVGTGVSLGSYPQHARVTGIDLSEAMLAEAQQMLDREGWDHIELIPMNAEQLHFDDASFDFVTSFHTISVVSNPEAMMREVVRVCKPGGRIVMINHFRSGNPIIARMVDSAGSVTRRLGWRTDLELRSLLSELPLKIERCYKPNPMSLFTVMDATRLPDEA